MNKLHRKYITKYHNAYRRTLLHTQHYLKVSGNVAFKDNKYDRKHVASLVEGMIDIEANDNWIIVDTQYNELSLQLPYNHSKQYYNICNKMFSCKLVTELNSVLNTGALTDVWNR